MSGRASGCPKRATEIAIQFREVPHRLFASRAASPTPNLLAIRIQPDEGIMLRFGAKIPGLGLDVRSVTMDFTYGSAFSVDSPDAYETLILDALQGDASLFTRADEVEEAWAIVDPIIASWADEDAADFPNYEAGHVGPARGRRAARSRRPQMASDLSRRMPRAADRDLEEPTALVGVGPTASPGSSASSRRSGRSADLAAKTTAARRTSRPARA